jgi:hypothetical protein
MKKLRTAIAIAAAILAGAFNTACQSRPPLEPAPDPLPEMSHAALPSASECADCHADTVAEWRASAHAFSAENPLIHAPVCGRCHAPVGTQLDPEYSYRYAEATPPAEVPAAAAEGVTCVVCHSQVEVPSSQLLHFEPEWPNWRTSDLAVRVLDFESAMGSFGSGTADDPLPVQQDYHASQADPRLVSAEMCRACHDLVVDKGPLEEQIGFPQPKVVLDSTFDEWVASDYPAQGKTCQSCHMPSRAALAPAAEAPEGQAFESALPPRRRTDHSFPGVHSAYWWDGPEREAKERQVGDMLEGIVNIDLEMPQRVASGTEFEIVVKLRNDGVGHDLPSGYGFWRDLWLELRVEDAAGRLLFGSGLMDEGDWLPDEYNPKVRQDPEGYDPFLWSLRSRMVRAPGASRAWIGSDRLVAVPEEAIRRNINGTPILGTETFDAGPIVARLLALKSAGAGAAPAALPSANAPSANAPSANPPSAKAPSAKAPSANPPSANPPSAEAPGRASSVAGPLEEVYTLRYGEAVIKNGIPAGETRQARYPVQLGAATVGPLRVSARLLMRPLSRSMTSQQEELADAPPPGPIYEIEALRVSLPIDGG